MHSDLQRVLDRAMTFQVIDFTVVWGHRNEVQQEACFDSRASKKHYPDSNHNTEDDKGEPCSDAMDLAPWINGGIPWKDEGSFYVLAGVIMVAAELENVELRYGGDWDRDGLTEDQTFMDLGHFERAKARG